MKQLIKPARVPQVVSIGLLKHKCVLEVVKDDIRKGLLELVTPMGDVDASHVGQGAVYL